MEQPEIPYPTDIEKLLKDIQLCESVWQKVIQSYGEEAQQIAMAYLVAMSIKHGPIITQPKEYTWGAMVSFIAYLVKQGKIIIKEPLVNGGEAEEGKR